MTTTVTERVAAFDEACVAAGREPSAIRRSTWAEGPDVQTEAGFEAFVRAHRALGFTDFAIVPADDMPPEVLRRIARERILALRAEFDASPATDR